jgi:hypothetical protein
MIGNNDDDNDNDNDNADNDNADNAAHAPTFQNLNCRHCHPPHLNPVR